MLNILKSFERFLSYCSKKFTFVLLYKRTPPLSNSFILIFDRLQFSPSKWSRNGTIWKFRHSRVRCQNGVVPITTEFSRIWFVKKCRDSRNQNTNQVNQVIKLFLVSKFKSGAGRSGKVPKVYIEKQISYVVVKPKK